MKFLKLMTLALLFPLVTYAQSDIVGDWKIEFPGENGATMSAKLTVASDGTYMVDFGMDSKIEVKGKYELDGNQMTIQDTGGDNSCGEDKKGIYQVTVSTDSMTMTRVSDECETRGGPEGTMTFTRIGS